jgi:hypothetical protein
MIFCQFMSWFHFSILQRVKTTTVLGNPLPAGVKLCLGVRINFFKINNKLLFIMKLIPITQ